MRIPHLNGFEHSLPSGNQHKLVQPSYYTSQAKGYTQGWLSNATSAGTLIMQQLSVNGINITAAPGGLKNGK